jgi:hypothetical protein
MKYASKRMIEINWILYHQPKQMLKAGDMSEKII